MVLIVIIVVGGECGRDSDCCDEWMGSVVMAVAVVLVPTIVSLPKRCCLSNPHSKQIFIFYFLTFFQFLPNSTLQSTPPVRERGEGVITNVARGKFVQRLGQNARAVHRYTRHVMCG